MKVLVNIYRAYFSIKSKNHGYEIIRTKSTLPAFINNRQTIHIGIFIMAAMTMFVNITQTNAENYIEGTLLNRLLERDFPQQELIVENADAITNDVNSKKPIKYATKGYVAVQLSTGGTLSEEDILQSQNIALARSGSALLKAEVATTQIEKNKRNSTIIYTVESGDTVTSIAKKFDISINTILWENDLTAYSIIRPGNELKILPATGVHYTVKKNDTIASISKVYQVEPEAILEENNLLDENEIKIAQVLFIPEGLVPRPKPAAGIVSPQVPSPKETFAAAPIGGDFIWPTNNYRVTQYYNWRHFGVDIGNKNGQPVYASAGGIVEISSQGRWNGGYGNQIVIDHENGFKTRYAHNSYNLVSTGERIVQGQVIAAIGSSGRSSGPHVHFEIEYQGRRGNPFNYLSR